MDTVIENVNANSVNNAVMHSDINTNVNEIGNVNNVMLTTFDNPYCPFTDFTHWFMFDVEKGYNTCSRLARIAKTSEQMTEKENDEEIERAIDEIIKFDFMNLYKKVTN